MTDKQKKAITLLNNLRSPMNPSEKPAITEDEYYTLLEFIIGEQQQPQITYVPYTPDLTPHYPWQTGPLYENTSDKFRVTCGATFSANNGKEE